MSWAKLDDGILDHPKIASVGPLGFMWYAAGLVYCNRNLTDGFIPYGIAKQLVPLSHTDSEGRIWTAAATCGMQGIDGAELVERLITSLLAARLWHEAPGGYRVHDFGDHNPTRSEVLERRAHIRAVRSEAGKRGAERTNARGKIGKLSSHSALVAANVAAKLQQTGQQNVAPVPVPVPEEKKISERTARAKKRVRKPHVPMPGDFVMNAEHEQALRGGGCRRPEIAFEAMKAYHLREGSLFADWNQAVRTWALNHERYGCPCQGANGKRHTPPEPTYPDLTSEVAADMARDRAEQEKRGR